MSDLVVAGRETLEQHTTGAGHVEPGKEVRFSRRCAHRRGPTPIEVQSVGPVAVVGVAADRGGGHSGADEHAVAGVAAEGVGVTVGAADLRSVRTRPWWAL